MNMVIAEKLPEIPTAPGVYLMKDAGGAVIYVGKAVNLKSRLSSYIGAEGRPDAKTSLLVEKIADVETIVTATAQEALILEANLIRRHKPAYNVILKDDKRYPSLRLDINAPYPCLQVVRKTRRDGALYFGPYASGLALRQTLKLINKAFKLRKCRTPEVRKRPRPCLNHQMGLCLAPCSLPVDPAVYAEMVDQVRLFLSGRPRILMDKIKADMQAAAERQEFEQAAWLRDRLFAVRQVVEKQDVVTNDFLDRDVVGVAKDNGRAMVVVLFIREGRLLGVRHYPVRQAVAGDAEILGAFFKHHYQQTHDIPREVLVPVPLEDSGIYGQWLSELRGRKVVILSPARGARMRLINMAAENAALRLKAFADAENSGEALLETVRHHLMLTRFPQRIECFDNSGTSGTNLVSGMAVFINGRPDPAAHRRYRIRTVIGVQDDYACMKEVLSRRFGKARSSAEMPDLIMVDGGKGQLHIAVSVLNELGLDQEMDVIGIAKADGTEKAGQDNIYKPGRANPLNLTRQAEVRYFLAVIRDEAHRLAVTFHRKTRNRAALRSRLDFISGIGPKRKAVLLKTYGGIEGIARASIDELMVLPGMNRKIASRVLAALSLTDNNQ
jgi:excinuclease ABC subunit C